MSSVPTLSCRVTVALDKLSVKLRSMGREAICHALLDNGSDKILNRSRKLSWTGKQTFDDKSGERNCEDQLGK